MKVKICGLTRLEDARQAIEAGADMIGFNFYPRSRRYIEPANCAGIVKDLGLDRSEVQLVGVFVNSPAAEVDRALKECGLDLAQLHGDESTATLQALGGRAFKAIRPTSLVEAEQSVRSYRPGSPAGGPALLVDAYRPDRYGGTGERADWRLARAVAATAPILLAGGLAPENVAEAMSQVLPWGVDVASGVESAPGRKDRRKMRMFVEAVRRCQGELVTR